MKTSETIQELAKALAEFNKEITRIEKDASNPFHKSQYATLDSILDSIRPILSKNGLSILQLPSGDGQIIEMKTMLLHTSGQFIESPVMTMKSTKNDAQALGSLITYAKRYQIGAMLGLSTGDPDDDGNSASNVKEKAVQQTIDKANGYVGKISDKQKNLIESKLNKLAIKFNITLEEIKEKKQIGDLSKMTSQEASALIKTITEWEQK